MRQNLQALEHDVGLGSDATEEPESLGVCNNVLQFINTSTTVENQPLDRQQSGLEDRINRLVAMKEELEHELSDWKLEKLLSESSLAHLKRYYEELNSVLDGYNVTLSARHHFPAEVWILIFQDWVIDRDSNFDHQSRPSPLILSHVCQEWRKVIRNAAILWKRVDIFPASWIPQGTMQYQKLVVQHGAHNTVEIIVDISRRWNWEAQANESAIAGRLYRPDRYRNSYLSSDSPNYCTDRSDLAQASSQTVTRPYSLVVRTKNADSQDLTRLGRIPFRSPFSLTLQSIQSISSPQLLPMIKLFEPIQKLNLDNISPPASTNPAVGPQLTHLEINMTNFSSYDLSSFLQPTLQDLRLRFRSDTALVLTRDSSTLTLPNLTTLGIEMVESPVTRLLARSSSSFETSFGRSWIIWAPLFSASAVFIAAVTAAESRPIRHHIPQSANSKDENASQPAEDEWAKPLTSFFGLDEPAEEGDRRSDSNAPSAGLGWKGLNFIRESLSVDSIPSLTASWIWPESIANMQAQIQALIVAIGRGPGSLYEQIIEETSKSPEASWDAHVRLGDDLCVAERAFLRERKRRMRHTFAEFIGVNEKEVKEEDIPIIAIAASGGGYRAMTNTTGSLVGAKESGLLDCIAYMAGISGSCWALGVLYSGLPSIASLPDPQLAAEHIKDRVSKTFFDTVTMELLTTAPTHKYLLSGLLLKATAPLGSVSLTDIYGTLISSRLFVPSDISKLDPDNLSLHKFRRFIDDGSMPLPIFTAIQHEIPHDAEKHLAEVQEQRDYLVDETRYKMLKREEEDIERKTRWLWYEFTPYEVGCDELG
ncbi:hypothetical protein FS842_002702, partial [Serendipita sp. 407]